MARRLIEPLLRARERERIAPILPPGMGVVKERAFFRYNRSLVSLRR